MSTLLVKQLGPVQTGGVWGEKIVFRDAVLSRCRITSAYDGKHIWLNDDACLSREQVDALIVHLQAWLDTGSLRFTFEKEEWE